MKLLLISIILITGLFCSNIDDKEVSIYIPKCDTIINKKYYKVCWNNELNVAESGWSIIDGSVIDKKNILARPRFYINDIVQTLKTDQIDYPNHRGHTFANDNDNDYSLDALRSTYDMINITPMHQTINIGAWRKVENRGNVLAKDIGEVISVTLVEYSNEEKYGIKNYPLSYTRIYITEDEHECYKVDNLDRKSDKLQSYKINCKTLLKH